MRKKTVRISLIGIAGLLVFVASLGVFASLTIRRSFPQVSGSIQLQNLEEPVEVLRDSQGIPHIYASNEHDLFFAQGFVHAQDRFFQMDFWRHIGAGRLAEMLGKSQIEADQFLRTMGWARVAEKELELLDPETLSLLQAYAEGVNAYLASHQGVSLSVEYGILKLISPSYQPKPWEPLHTLIWAKVMAWDLSGNKSGWQELNRAILSKELGEARVADLYPPYPDNHPFIVPNPLLGDGQKEPSTGDTSANPENSNPGSFNPSTGGSESTIGSNSWVVSSGRSDSGAPLLANDPHLGIQMPSIWYEIGLHCRPVSEKCRFNVGGFSFAGSPGVVIGHNDRIAWGLTNLGPDVLDLTVERINPNDPYQYEVNGEWVEMDIVEESILVAGGDPVPITIRYTHHGSLISDVDDRFADLDETTDLEIPPEYGVALQWTALEPGTTLQSIFKINLAEDWESFREALREFVVPSQNFVYADIDGNIGYQAPGRIPIRSEGDGTLPTSGWKQESEWVGFIPFDELPYSFNPPEEMIVTANNAVVGSAYAYQLSSSWDSGYRAERILGQLESQTHASLADMQAMQGDNYHPMAPLLIPILSELTFSDPDLAALVDQLNTWDFQNGIDSAEAAVFNSFWRHLLLKTFADEIPENLPGGSHAFQIVANLSQDAGNVWWDDVTTPQVEDRDGIFHQAFSDAVDELKKALGRRPEDWSWGALHTATFESPLGLGPLKWIFNRGPFPTAGGSSIVNATGWKEELGYQVVSVPSMRMIVDLGDFGRSLSIHTTGQSGHAFHPHYIDMADPWRKIQYTPMRWDRSQIESTTENWLFLTPPKE